MFNIFHLKRFYTKLLQENLYYFLFALFLLGCSPIISSFLFEYIVIKNNSFSPIALLVIVLILITLLFSFISISIWSSIKSNFHGTKKLLLIIFSYLMLWFTFGNIYYFFLSIENYLSLKDIVISEPFIYLENLFCEHQLIKGIEPFWNYDSTTQQYQCVNRYYGYINLLYFSGTTMLTIGYGDLVPLTPFIKMLSIMQAFLAQFINVVAVGIWLNSVKK